MRSFFGGLLGLCLGLALLPQDALARTDARSSVQNTGSSRAVMASRPTTGAASATRSTAGTQRQASAPRSASAQRSASAPRQTLTQRSASPNRSVQRGTTSRHAAAIPYSRQNAAPQRGLRQTAMASCTTRNGRRVCGPGVTNTASMRWTGGLAPAAMSQSGCPDGTIATLAIGHSDITRCVPL